MNASDREGQLRALLAERGHAAALGVGVDEDLPHALELDSLASLRVLAMIEKHFRVRFPDERLGQFRTVRQIAAWLSEAPREEAS